MKISKFCSVLLATCSVALDQTAQAATATGNLLVTAEVDPTCAVTTIPVDFGSIDPSANTAFLATGTVSVRCTVGTNWTASAEDGVNPLPVGTGFIRSMEGQNPVPARLEYELYVDSARTELWKSGFFSIDGVGTGSAQDQIIYGTIPANQTAIPPDSYQDTITVDIDY